MQVFLGYDPQIAYFFCPDPKQKIWIVGWEPCKSATDQHFLFFTLTLIFVVLTLAFGFLIFLRNVEKVLLTHVRFYSKKYNMIHIHLFVCAVMHYHLISYV